MLPSGLRSKMEELGFERFDVSQIGCVLDKLRWVYIRKVLLEVFTGSSTTLEVFTLAESAPLLSQHPAVRKFLDRVKK